MTDRNIWDFDAGPYDEVQPLRVRVFEKIAPEGNWKLPINAVISEDEVDECNEAAVWFAGCGITIAERLADGKVRVTGPGYYHAVGA